MNYQEYANDPTAHSRSRAAMGIHVTFVGLAMFAYCTQDFDNLRFLHCRT